MQKNFCRSGRGVPMGRFSFYREGGGGVQAVLIANTHHAETCLYTSVLCLWTLSRSIDTYCRYQRRYNEHIFLYMQ